MPNELGRAWAVRQRESSARSLVRAGSATLDAVSSTMSHALLVAAGELSRSLARLHFGPPIAHVYDPHTYAWAPYEAYVQRFGATKKRVVLLGMNPGPFGMMQTGVPFGEVAAVREWMGIRAPVKRPNSEHPKRPIEGFDCPRSEVSGHRLWAWAALHFGTAEAFFADWFVVNYCPLVFLEASGRNFTPDRLPVAKRTAVRDLCDRHLAVVLAALQPEWVIGIGRFAEKRLREVLLSDRMDSVLVRHIKVAHIPHPSPASPLANQGWNEAVDRSLADLGLLLGR